MSFMETALTGFAISTTTGLVYAALSNIVMKVYGGRDRLTEIQKETKRLNELAQKALASNDEKKKKEAERYQEQIMSLTSESLKLSMKQMVVVLPLFFIFAGLINGVDNVLGVQVHFIGVKQAYPFEITLPISIPVPTIGQAQWITWRNTFGVWGWFILTLIFSSLIMQGLVPQIQKLMKGAAK